MSVDAREVTPGQGSEELEASFLVVSTEVGPHLNASVACGVVGVQGEKGRVCPITLRQCMSFRECRRKADEQLETKTVARSTAYSTTHSCSSRVDGTASTLVRVSLPYALLVTSPSLDTTDQKRLAPSPVPVALTASTTEGRAAPQLLRTSYARSTVTSGYVL